MLTAVVDVAAFNAFEAAGWETRAADYGHYWLALTSRLSDPLLDAVGVGPNTGVLDIACGPGHMAGRAAERGGTGPGRADEVFRCLDRLGRDAQTGKLPRFVPHGS